MDCSKRISSERDHGKTSRYDRSTEHWRVIYHSTGQPVCWKYYLSTLKHGDTIYLQHTTKFCRCRCKCWWQVPRIYKNLKTSRYDLSTQHLSIISHSRGQLVSCRYDLFTLKHADTIHLQHASKHFRKIRYSKISSMKPLVMLSVRVEVGKFLNCK